MDASIGVLARLRASEERLDADERRVVQVILARPEEVAGWSVAQLAAAAQTSPATVTRACRSAGLRGFQRLRLELSRPARDAPDVPGAPFDAAIDALRLARDGIDASAIEQAVDMLAGAARLVLVGTGFSSAALQDAALRIATLGRCVEAPVDAMAQQVAVRGLGAEDAVLAVSRSGANAHTLAACRAAADRGAVVVAITSTASSPVATAATLAIVTPAAPGGAEVDPFLSRLAHQVVLQGIHDGLGRRLGARAAADMRAVVADALTDD